MTLEIEDRPSESPFVERVWRSRSSEVDQMMAIASPRWALVFWEQAGRTRATVIGPETHASHAPVPEDAVFFGIDFALGATLPHLALGRLVDGSMELPDTTSRSFRLLGSRWRIPSYDNAEAFVRCLVREDIVARDALVADVAGGSAPDLSNRTVQRRFLAATGLTRDAVRQIDRARHATVLLRDGVPTSQVIERCGYYDQPHLARSLRRFIGRTPKDVRSGRQTESMSLLYKT
ncbi:MAG TPA: helix-turn-helix domain-containing protein [Nocardioidaceae bacterium]|nr:helix-turn-helix domain-containing protein [Nocardioidaceae bacterium]